MPVTRRSRRSTSHNHHHHPEEETVDDVSSASPSPFLSASPSLASSVSSSQTSLSSSPDLLVNKQTTEVKTSSSIPFLHPLPFELHFYLLNTLGMNAISKPDHIQPHTFIHIALAGITVCIEQWLARAILHMTKIAIDSSIMTALTAGMFLYRVFSSSSLSHHIRTYERDYAFLWLYHILMLFVQLHERHSLIPTSISLLLAFSLISFVMMKIVSLASCLVTAIHLSNQSNDELEAAQNQSSSQPVSLSYIQQLRLVFPTQLSDISFISIRTLISYYLQLWIAFALLYIQLMGFCHERQVPHASSTTSFSSHLEHSLSQLCPHIGKGQVLFQGMSYETDAPFINLINTAYFSLAIITTLGFGDIYSAFWSSRICVIVQLLLSCLLYVVILSKGLDLAIARKIKASASK